MKVIVSGLLRRICRSLTFRKRLPKEFGSAQLFVSPRADMRVLYPSFQRAAFDLMLVSRLYVKEGACVWDIGSNQGIFSACAAYKAGPNGKVYSLEADPRYSALQNRSFAFMPKTYAPVRVLCAAAAEATSLMRLAVSRQGHTRSHLAGIQGQQACQTESFQEVVAVTLDFLLEHWPAPDVVKIDVEGAEAFVLEGANRLLSEVAPIFYIEVSDQNSNAVSECFRRHGYDIFKLKADGSECPIEFCGLYTIAKPGRVPGGGVIMRSDRSSPAEVSGY